MYVSTRCELSEKSRFESVNFVKNEIFKMWILWKITFWKCEFCEKSHFENVNFVEKMIFLECEFVRNKISKMWILSEIEYYSKCEFLDKIRKCDPRKEQPKWHEVIYKIKKIRGYDSSFRSHLF